MTVTSMMKAAVGWCISASLVLGWSCPVRGESVDFNRDIRPLLSNKCFTCHGPDAAERQAGLRLDLRDAALAVADSGATVIVPGQPDASELIRRVGASDPAEQMPPPETGKSLTDEERALLSRWVAEGAPYAQHWAYAPLKAAAVPTAKELTSLAADNKPVGGEQNSVNDTVESWPRNEIDPFVLKRLIVEQLRPTVEAEKRALMRRVTLDLTGLPPQPDDVISFVSDTRPDAYERLVDRLLASDTFGEHWARKWLDLARYADSTGYADDVERTIWGYRDYVIHAFNENKPFDDFTIDQLAGDLLVNPTPEQLVATAFHRNTQTNNEGGTNDEEYRNVAIVDRVNTTMSVWMGTTMACAQCHNHKYDPISQEDYFRLFAVFNNSADADRRDESPVTELWTEEVVLRRRRLQDEVSQLRARLASVSAEETEQRAGWESELAAIEKQLADLKPYSTVPVMQELAGEQLRRTFVQYRGNFMALGPEVGPALPPILGDNSMAAGRAVDRLTLARWLVDPRNGLTARVVANRYWESIFGRGIVVTSEEFGAQGDLPTHPELLDWLAGRLIDSDWNTKAFLKLLVTSATYRQSSRVTPEAWERDPANEFYARGPRFRLSAEMVRDQALAVSGLLSDKMFGAPVKPQQPAIGLSAAFGGGIDWQTSAGEDRYRRAIYTSWRRSNPYPSMTTFDAPNREVCTMRRDRTNTPLQALVTLNDPVYIEAAQALGRSMFFAGNNDTDRVRFGLERCLVRAASAEECAELVGLHTDVVARFQGNREAAVMLATQPLGELPSDTDPAVMAAWSVVANVILNLDEMLMKP